jgi:hypothetical protein
MNLVPCKFPVWRAALAAALALSSLVTTPVEAQEKAGSLPLFVIGPPGHSGLPGVHDLCEYPDQWKAVRADAGELLCSDHTFKKDSDPDVARWLAQLQSWNLKLELEVGAVKPWGPTGEETFRKERVNWDRILRLGGHIASIAMDEPLSACRREEKKPDRYAVEETANFIALVQQNYPDIKVIEIEPYPSIPLADHKIWIASLQKALADRNLKPLIAYRLDVDWLNFSIRSLGSWREVKELEDYCHSVGLPFSLIYWSAGYGYWEKRKMADDSTWYTGIMGMGYDYASVGGKPDQYVIESWVGAPSTVVPETNALSFTGSALYFYNKFVKPNLTGAQVGRSF